MIKKLEPAERDLLRFLLERGGWGRLNEVTRKFSSMEGDGYFWSEYPPESPLGRLWMAALVFVGQANLKGRRCRIATVPVELRETLEKALKYF